ncbi:MAG: response regulator [Chloroflexota bacterium]
MDNKRVLIVDDDKNILYLLEHSLTRLGANYQVFTTLDSSEAIELVRKQSFDLVVADYMMPGITGVDLARAIRQVSPDTQIILMTAYGTPRLKTTTRFVGIDGFLDKPFSIDEIHAVIQKTVQMAHQQQDESPPAEKSSNFDKAVRSQLEVLQVNTNARCVMLLDAQGAPSRVIGRVSVLEKNSIGAFVAKNFAAAAELAGALHSRSIFKSSYYEGDDYNLYACQVNTQYHLAVVFESRHKPGVVWFYTKQTASSLAQMFG